ncbi:MAG TPA: putative glycolipid-binding domain-containing protein [Iamia sp.]|nr:putative glycolipid-binding domain-containing protein [Iamia sp.]
MELSPFPPLAAWRHVEAREGYEVLSVHVLPVGVLLDGHTTAVEDGEAFAVGYRIEVDERWRTRRAVLRGWWPHGEGSVVVEGDGAGSWAVDGVDRPDLEGCLDVDLESSACTNALPLRRLDLAVGAAGSSPAAYVRALDLAVERLEQDYLRLPDDGDHVVAHYVCERFDADFDLTYDRTGLVVDYPGLAVRAS